MSRRDRVMTCLAERPWSTSSELAEAAGVDGSWVRHVMATAQVEVVKMRARKSRRWSWHYAPAGTPAPADLRQPTERERQIAEYVAAHPWATAPEIEGALGMSRTQSYPALRTEGAYDRIKLRCPSEGRWMSHYAHPGTPRPEGHREGTEREARAEAGQALPAVQTAEEVHRESRMERHERVKAVAQRPCIGCGATWRRSRVRAVPYAYPQAPERADVGGRPDLVPVCQACLAAVLGPVRPHWWCELRAKAQAVATAAGLALCLLLPVAGCLDETEDCGPWGCEGDGDSDYTPPPKEEDPCPYSDAPIGLDGRCTWECEEHADCEGWEAFSGISRGCFYSEEMDLQVCQFVGDR